MEKPIKKKRRVTLIRDKPKKKLQSLHVNFDHTNRAIGATQPGFGSYCGAIARTRISCLIESWDKVPKSQLDDLWLEIKNHWHIPNDNAKKRTLSVCNQA